MSFIPAVSVISSPDDAQSPSDLELNNKEYFNLSIVQYIDDESVAIEAAKCLDLFKSWGLSQAEQK